MILIEDILRTDVKQVQESLGFTSTVFKCCTGNEFIQSLKKLNKFQRYPFFFINNNSVTYDNTNPNEIFVTIGEIVMATLSRPEYSSEDRLDKIFKPILLPFYDAFIFQMDNSKGAAISERGTLRTHYFYGRDGLYGEDGNIFEDFVDAISLKNYKFRILK